jgi:two-component system sensor histidine kinase TctE
MTPLPPARSSLMSLRRRLFLLILLPLILVALLAGALRYWQAQTLSQALYDNALKVVAHVVAREVILTQGDVVSDALLNSLVGVLGDPIFYNVSAADGRILAGYTDLPAGVLPDDLRGGEARFFDFRYNGRPVRAIALREFIADPFFDGWTTVLVWQTTNQRHALSLVILRQALTLLAMVIATAAVAVWIGIALGLRPLTDLRDAISLRNPSELRPIRRGVPAELRPLVATVNSLLSRLDAELRRRNAFVANAAHQLRNPVAAIRAQAEAALSTRDPGQREDRLRDLHEAAQDLSRLSQQLLSLETADHAGATPPQALDLNALVSDTARRFAPLALQQGVEVHLNTPAQPQMVLGNAILLREAIENLLDNALRYGAVAGGEIRLDLARDESHIRLCVDDDGPGVPQSQHDQVFERFVRLPLSTGRDQPSGCGLGLAIVRSIAGAHGGAAYIAPRDRGLSVVLSLPALSPVLAPDAAPAPP